MDVDRSAEIAATFERIRRPLRWPMENFRRRHVANRQFVGYRFSRVRRQSIAGFCFGFALRNDSLPGITEAPRSEEHTSELQSRENLVCRLLLEKKKSKEITRGLD